MKRAKRIKTPVELYYLIKSLLDIFSTKEPIFNTKHFLIAPIDIEEYGIDQASFVIFPISANFVRGEDEVLAISVYNLYGKKEFLYFSPNEYKKNWYIINKTVLNKIIPLN